jgi:hypothetical protein
MNRHFFTAVFLLGAMALVWIGAGFFGSNPLALAVTIIIAAVYGVGALELWRFRQATFSLDQALAAIPAPLTQLDTWLANVHASLQNPVRLRIEGERIGLPGPALTPYLVGLLVMLGMLGTFLGMVVTLNGAVFALEGTTDLHAIRAALAAPIKGLGLSFGTSVAGVAASAMLGLMSALSRRERSLTAQWLDTQIATVLRGFSLTHQRQETFKALQSQSQALPLVVDQLQAMMGQMQRMSEQLSQQLLTNQEGFHSHVQGVYTELAHSVDTSLRNSLSQSAQAAGESLKPVVEAAMTGIAQDARQMHERMIDAAQAQLDGFSARFNANATAVVDNWSAALARHEHSSTARAAQVSQTLEAFTETIAQRSATLVATVGQAYTTLQAEQATGDKQRLQAWTQSLQAMAAKLGQEWQQTSLRTLQQQQQLCATLSQTARDITGQAQTSTEQTLSEIQRLMAGSDDLVRARIASEAQYLQQHNQRMDELATLLRRELGALKDDEAQRGNAAVARLGELQAALTTHLTTLGTALEAPIQRLIETASEAPRAAAEVIGQLRQEISHSVARDNDLLQERSRIMETLNSLLTAINHASEEQRSVIDAMLASSAVTLGAAGSQFAEKVDLEATKLADIAAHVTSSAVDVSSLSQAFSFAVTSFNEANEKLMSNLQRIEAALDKSMARSDDQLAYYVAQAREVIDLSLMSQKEIVEELRQLPGKQALLAEEAR